MSIINRNPYRQSEKLTCRKESPLNVPKLQQTTIGSKSLCSNKKLASLSPHPKKKTGFSEIMGGWVSLLSLMHAKHRNAKKGFSEIMGGRVGGKFTSLNRTMFGCRSDL
jgi:hypothetical protein